MIFKLFSYLFCSQISAAYLTSIFIPGKNVLFIRIYILLHTIEYKMLTACYQKLNLVSKHETKQCSKSPPALWQKFPASNRLSIKPDYNYSIFVAIILQNDLTDIMMPTGRNSGSPLSLYRSTVMFSHQKAGQVSRKRLQPMTLAFSWVVPVAESLEMEQNITSLMAICVFLLIEADLSLVSGYFPT